MKNLTRRDFLKTSSALAAGAVLTQPVWTMAAPAPTRQLASSAVDRTTLGNTGIKLSFLAQGTGVHGGSRQSDHTRMGQKEFTRQIRHGFDQGVNFWDMADLYGTHPFMRQAMSEIPRDKYVCLSKIWTRDENWNDPSGGATREVRRFTKELGVEYLDICLIHCMIDKDWTEKMKRVRDELSELKQKGEVRAVGVSCHSHDALKAAAEHPWVEVIFARINNKGGSEYRMDGTVEEISATLKKARRNGKAVVGMKIFGEGKLIEPDQKDASLNYVIGNNLVDAMTIGMLKTEEINDSIERVSKALKA